MANYREKTNSIFPIQAHKIFEVHFDESFLLLENGDRYPVTESYLHMHNPRPGGYVIVNQGWDSYCACEFFEETFREAE